MKVFHVPLTRSLRVLWLLEELGLPYEVELIDRADLKNEDFLKLNPLARVPALIDGDVTLFESGAILQYLLEKVPDTELAPKPGTPERAPFLQWLHGVETLAQAGSAVVQHAFVRPEADRIEKIAEEGRETAAFYFAGLDRELAQRPFIAGDTFTAADIMLGYTLYVSNMIGLLSKDATPNLFAYFEKVTGRDAFQKVIA